jgi:hypothetical protein
MYCTASPAIKVFTFNHAEYKSQSHIRRQTMSIGDYLMKRYGFGDWKAVNAWELHKTIITLIMTY